MKRELTFIAFFTAMMIETIGMLDSGVWINFVAMALFATRLNRHLHKRLKPLQSHHRA